MVVPVIAILVVVALVEVAKLVRVFHGHAVAALPVIVTGEAPRIVKLEQDTEPEQEALVVATVPSVFALVQYARSPVLGFEDVEMPLYAKTPVDELYASGKTAESEEDEILLLKVVQSVEER